MFRSGLVMPCEHAYVELGFRGDLVSVWLGFSEG